MIIESLVENLEFGVIGYNGNFEHLIKCNSVLGKNLTYWDGLANNYLAEVYWKLDGCAFDNQPAPKFMKLDTLILGGCPICIFLPKGEVDKGLVKKLGAENLDIVPIGFMDMHKIGEGKYVCSGLGIAKEYQGNGLSKYLIHAGLKITGVKELIIPTQLSNASAHYAWLHLGQLKILKIKPCHNEEDTIVYQTNIENPEQPVNRAIKDISGALKVSFQELLSHPELYEGKFVVGYFEDSLLVK